MQKTQTTCLLILTTIAVGVSLYFLRSVLLPFVIALFVVIGCRPILDFLEHQLRLNRFLAFAVTFLMGFALVTGLGLMVWASINDLSKHPEAYEKRLNSIVNRVALIMEEKFESDSDENQSKQPPSEQGKTSNPSATPTNSDNAQHDALNPAGQPNERSQEINLESDFDSPVETEAVTLEEKTSKAVQDLVKSISTYLQSILFRLAASLSTLLSYGVLILIFVFFLLSEQGQNRNKRPELISEIEGQIRKYLVMKTVISFFTGLTFGFILWLFGIPLAILFGTLAFVLNFIPNIGPLVANALPVPFLVLNSQLSPVAAITCLILISATQFISGNVVETRLMGKSFDVSPTVLLLALMFFGLIWGIVGMFLATPIVSIVKIVLNQSRGGRNLSELMAGRWVATNQSNASSIE